LLNNGSPSLKKDKTSLLSLHSQMDRLSLGTNCHLLDEHRASVFMKDVSPLVETMLHTKILRKWIRGNGFDFKPSSKVECPICGVVHDSNDYRVRPILGDSFFLGNYSSKCSLRAFNWETLECLKMILHTPAVDRPYSMMLNVAIRSHGFQPVYTCNTAKEIGRFMCFNGYIWQEIGTHRVRNDIADTCSETLDNLLRSVHPQKSANKDQIKLVTFQRKQLATTMPIIFKPKS
ncbi:hypothetical protein BGX27_003228, partial [Mortierella sp. AM989]